MAVNDGVVIYDIEIINPIRPKELKGTWLNSLNQWKAENPDKEIVFSDSWTDFQSMGIACIGAYDYQTDLFRVFLKDNMIDFITLINSRKCLVGYNNINFDDKILFTYYDREPLPRLHRIMIAGKPGWEIQHSYQMLDGK